MMKNLTAILLLVGVCMGASLPTAAQSVSYGKLKTVQLNAEVDDNSNKVTLNWKVYAQADSFEIYRMNSSGSWPSSPLATVDSTTLSYVDSNLNQNQVYEYKVIARRSTYDGFGYVASAIKLAEKTTKGSILVMVDSLLRDSIADALAQYELDLMGDGYTVIIQDFDTSNSADALKDSIASAYSTLGDLETVFLVGALPYAYTGTISPDGHYDHRGAWPSDMIYADVNSSYTDATVNYTNNFDSRHTNTTTDTKFDQSYLMSDAEIHVGRLDLSRLTAFSQDEHILYRNYFAKLHDFKAGDFVPRQRALVDDNFTGYTEGFSQNGYRNFSPLTASDSVTDGDILTNLQSSSALWSYACGGGSFTSISGFATTTNLASNTLGGTFALVLGSYNADVDQENNLMRSMLANGNFLTAGWAGRPNWFMQHMGLGYTIGRSTLISQNNTDSRYEPEGNYARMMHVLLLGDPTLKNHYTPNVDNLYTIRAQNKDTAHLTWNAQSGVLGYRVYRSKEEFGTYTQLTSGLLTSNEYDDPISPDTTYYYRIESVELVENLSGSYYESSVGAVIISDKNAAPLPVSLIRFVGTKADQSVQLDWTVADEINFSHYEVEKRDNTTGEWKFLEEIQGVGNAWSITEYRTFDHQPVIGENVYRLKMVDFDASFEYSDPVSVLFSEELQAGSFSLSPTLAHSYVDVNGNWMDAFGRHAFILTDMNGRVLKQFSVDRYDKRIDVSELTPGMYLIHDTSGSSAAQRFVKTN